VADGPSYVFSERLACAACGISFPEVSPRMFSFNNPYGACPECGGIGTRYEIDPALVAPNPARSLKDGALAPGRPGRGDVQADPRGAGAAVQVRSRHGVGQAC